MGTTSGSSARNAALALAAALVLALGAGCGGGSDDEGSLSKAAYEQQLKSVGSNLKTSLSAAAFGETENLGNLAASLDHLRTQLDQAAKDLARLDPPKGAEAANAQLVSVLRRSEGTVSDLARAAHANNVRRVNQLHAQAAGELQALRDAANELRSKGYQVGLLGQH